MRSKVFIKTLNGTDTISSLLEHDEMKHETDQAGSDSVIVRIDLWASEDDTSHQGELHIYYEDRWIDIESVFYSSEEEVAPMELGRKTQ